MLNIIFKIFCTVSSLSIALWIYAVNKQISIVNACEKFGIETEQLPRFLSDRYVCAFLYFAILLLVAYICIIITKKKKSSVPVKADSIEPAGEGVMLTYLGLFFYALSVSDIHVMVMSFLLLCVGCFLTNRYSFNPLYLFFGYRFYNVISGKKRILMISKERIQFNDSITFEKPIKLNEFTFFDTNR